MQSFLVCLRPNKQLIPKLKPDPTNEAKITDGLHIASGTHFAGLPHY